MLGVSVFFLLNILYFYYYLFSTDVYVIASECMQLCRIVVIFAIAISVSFYSFSLCDVTLNSNHGLSIDDKAYLVYALANTG